MEKNKILLYIGAAVVVLIVINILFGLLSFVLKNIFPILCIAGLLYGGYWLKTNYSSDDETGSKPEDKA